MQKIKIWYDKLRTTPAPIERSGISPKRDWRILLVSTVVLVCMIGGISLYFYIQINKGQLFVTVRDNTEKEITIDSVLLEKTINDINIRKITLEDIKQNKSIPPDPSI